MILVKTFARFIGTSGGPKLAAVEQSPLAALRKKTGYTFANCKKALELHNNDLQKAENWLKEQAQAMGWSKATKLQGRQTTQGLVGVAFNNTTGVLVEVNCETDFVARNKEFEKIVATTTNTCLKFAESYNLAQKPITKICLTSEQLRKLPTADGKLLSDHLALMIGTVGENAVFKRAICLKVDDNLRLVGYSHPSGKQTDNVLLGRLAALVALKSNSGQTDDLQDVGKDICQHVVGMNPQKIGNELDKPSGDKNEENCLIYQEYLLDDSLQVKEVLDSNNLEVVDFKRFECGECLNGFGDQPLEYVETCQ